MRKKGRIAYKPKSSSLAVDLLAGLVAAMFIKPKKKKNK